jgi:hypothetical protein
MPGPRRGVASALAAAMPEGGSCQCRRRNSWRPACWFISAGSDFPKAAPFRDDPGAVRGGKAERIPYVGRPFRATRVPLAAGFLTAKPSSPSYVNVINIHNLDFIWKIVRA